MSESFQEDIAVVLPSVSSSAVAWGDYNRDGKPDFLLTGLSNSTAISKLYKNTGSGFSEDTTVKLPGVISGAVAWSDYNSDSKPDFLLMGDSGNKYISKLYKNTGSGFNEDTSVNLPGVIEGSVAWADYNKDGKRDFLLTGQFGSKELSDGITKLYKNTGDGFIVDSNFPVINVGRSAVAWADYNSDDRIDFILTGNTYNTYDKYITKLYKNTESGFREDDTISLPGVTDGAVAWSDYNRDDQPDFLLTGKDTSEKLISKLYKNTGDGFIEDTNVSLPGVDQSSVAWGDYNRDGKPDFLLTGNRSGTAIAKLYINTGNGFSEDTSISLPGVKGGSVARVDYNEDSKPDFLLTGQNSSTRDIGKIYKNTFTTQTITGTAGPDSLMGTPNPEIINGLAGDDKLNGNGGDDTLIGLSGNDTLLGRDGDDVYIINSTGDIINESLHEGTDLVQSFITYTLTANVEKLTLKGARSINGTGNIIDNSIIGNNSNNVLNGEGGFDNLKGVKGDDTLNGGESDDTLNGGSGNDVLDGGPGGDVLTGNNDVDTFVFHFNQSRVGNSDHITDFTIGTDKIELPNVGIPNKLSRASNNNATNLLTVVKDVFNDANALSGNQPLGINCAVVVVATDSSIAGTYLIINEGDARFYDSEDLMINITGYSISPFLGNTLPDIEMANRNIQPELIFI